LWAGCEHPVARLVAAQGEVRGQESGRNDWHAAVANQGFCAGDKIRTQDRSRATLALNNQTYLTLDQRTTVVLSGLQEKKPSWLDLLKGAIYLRSRTPSSLDVKTPFINAAIKGTEFLVASGEAEGQVTVFEGRVEASNPKGSVTLDAGQTATAQAGQAPVRKLLITPEDAVQWALYYPPLIDLAALRRAAADPAVKRAAALYLAGDSLGALRELDSSGNNYEALRASLLLSLGRLDEAQPLIDQIPKSERGQALALRSVISLTRGDKSQALLLAEQATQAQPASPVPWTALSYARQAQFDLPAALAAAQKAAELAPDNGLVQTRLAELLDATGDRQGARKAAQRATELNPNLARGWTLLGFTQLADLDRDAAKASFDTALRTDPSDPLAHFGRGLTQIRNGDLEAGTAELELAASLDPNDSLTRSYVGKAYYEQKRSKPAQGQYDLAKQYDPKDPTPWFYDAIKKQAENRPVEAIADLQHAIELNDDRAVYRSRQMLDSDLAARGAAIGRIYNELGFAPRGLVESWKALAAEPGDYSSHRLLSDSYSTLPRHDFARASELLQSQLLQPINITPVQPRLAESSLFLIGNLGPSALSLNEFNPLFDRNGFATLVSGLVGSQDTYGDEVVHSGIWDNWSYSLGQMHYQTGGYRKNNDIDANLYNAFVQGRITPDFGVQAEYRHRDLEYGDLSSSFFPPPDELRPFVDPLLANKRQQSSTDTYRIGFNWGATEHSRLLGSFVHLEQDSPSFQAPYAVVLPGSAPIPVPGSRDDDFARGNNGEVQHRYGREDFKSILGGGFGQIDLNDNGRIFSRQQQGNGYWYLNIRYPATVTWTLGASVDAQDDSQDGKSRRGFNPKGGVLWNITPNTTLRAAAFRTQRRFLFGGQTLEPTQLAGFNQFYDDPNGTRADRYGIGLDQRFTPTLSGGAELSERQLQVPALGADYQSWRETQYRGYLLWTPMSHWATTLEYYREDFSNLESSEDGGPRDTQTQYIPASVAYFDPTGWFTRLRATHYHQRVSDGSRSGSDDAVFLDLGLGYRFPRRLGLLEVQLQNLLDQHYRYEAYGLRADPSNSNGGIPSSLPFAPDFSVSARFTLAF
jgi:tetratricopeptide (TPR) repeat protein